MGNAIFQGLPFEICVRLTPVAKETKIWKFPHKIYHNSARIQDRSQNFAPNWGFWGLADQPESFKFLLEPPLLPW